MLTTMCPRRVAIVILAAALAAGCANARDVDHYVVFAMVKMRSGIYRVAFDHEAATAALKRAYPPSPSIPGPPGPPELPTTDSRDSVRDHSSRRSS
jgi:hypothetical protein